MREGVFRRIQQYMQILFRVQVEADEVLFDVVGHVRGDRDVYVIAALATGANEAQSLNLMLQKALVEATFQPYIPVSVADC